MKIPCGCERHEEFDLLGMKVEICPKLKQEYAFRRNYPATYELNQLKMTDEQRKIWMEWSWDFCETPSAETLKGDPLWP